ncbi:MAG: acyltransferase family protein [[Eubacterium] siraeum]|nr:acyltransferase family protein [[Eubacterium] siraeum]
MARFLFSVLVVGYHVQMSVGSLSDNFFENGALAVEFFFLLSGYFLARSMEKVSAKENSRIFSESCRYMKGKIKGILPTHLITNISAALVIAVFDTSNAGMRLLNGLPSIFLVQMAVISNNSYENALVVPEWYLSSMLICMLFIFPIAMLLRKKLRGELVTVVLIGILIVIIIAALLAGQPFTQNFI